MQVCGVIRSYKFFGGRNFSCGVLEHKHFSICSNFNAQQIGQLEEGEQVRISLIATVLGIVLAKHDLQVKCTFWTSGNFASTWQSSSRKFQPRVCRERPTLYCALLCWKSYMWFISSPLYAGFLVVISDKVWMYVS